MTLHIVKQRRNSSDNLLSYPTDSLHFGRDSQSENDSRLLTAAGHFTNGIASAAATLFRHRLQILTSVPR